MIREGGLGDFKAQEVGPSKVQFNNGVIDILVENEKEAVEKVKTYLSYFQGNTPKWNVSDQNLLKNLIPEDRKYAYDVTKILQLIFDQNSVLELRKGFAKNMITSLARINGKSVGVIANSTKYLSGAIDGDASDKASRFMQLCDAFNFPIISFCDTPGFMVGPDHEKLALVRKTSRLFLNGANLTVPIMTIILRKAYGLGSMAMAGGNFHESYMTLSWQTGEFGPMGLEASVKLGFKKEILPTLNRRIIIPFYIPAISLICSLLLMRSKKIYFNKTIIFAYSFSLLLFTELAVRYTGLNNILLSLFIIIPIFLFLFFYLFLNYKFLHETNAS